MKKRVEIHVQISKREVLSAQQTCLWPNRHQCKFSLPGQIGKKTALMCTWTINRGLTLLALEQKEAGEGVVLPCHFLQALDCLLTSAGDKAFLLNCSEVIDWWLGM